MPSSAALTIAIPTAAGTPTHPTYALWAPVWRDLTYVYEGSGPLRSGAAIIAHPREYLDHTIQTTEQEKEEHADGSVTLGATKTVSKLNQNPKIPSPKLLERQKLAAYENFAAPIVDHKLAALLRKPPTRRVKGENQKHDWLTWCQTDVDGAGSCLDDFMRDAERLALIFGHAVIVMDRIGGVEQPITRAQQGTPALRLYSPLDMPDWLQDRTGALTAVKLFEVAPRASLKDASPSSTTYRVRIIDGESFEVLNEGSAVTPATPLNEGPHGFGRLPVVLLYAKRRALTPIVGQSVLYDPKLFTDYYNMSSEMRELMRKQVFSILNIPLGTGDGAMDVEAAKALIGETTGTTNVLFSGQAASFITADVGNVDVYLNVRAALLRTIYRLANVPFETDSKDAEAAGSLALKREDMNQVLASYADEMQRSEEAIAELWFRGTYGEQWEAEWDRVEPTVSYPETFDVTPFAEILAQAQAALALPLGRSKTFMLELAKRVAPRLLTDATPDTLEAIFKELEKLPDPEQERKDRLKEMAGRMAASPELQPKDGPVKPEDVVKPKEPAAA